MPDTTIKISLVFLDIIFYCASNQLIFIRINEVEKIMYSSNSFQFFQFGDMSLK